MKGYIAVGDDLQFQNQTVEIGATLTARNNLARSRFGGLSASREDSVYRSFKAAVPTGFNLGHVPIWQMDNPTIDTTIRPKYRIFECELGGNVVPSGDNFPGWSCDTVTITKEVTREVPKATSTTVETVCAAHVYGFNQPFTIENILALLDKCYAIICRYYTVEPSRISAMFGCIADLFHMYGLKTRTLDVANTLNELLRVYDAYEDALTRGSHLASVLLRGYLKNANFSVEERLRIRDEIRTWYQQSTHPYTSRPLDILQHLDQFLEVLQEVTTNPSDARDLNDDGSSRVAMWMVKEYITTLSASEIDTLFRAHMNMGRPVAMRTLTLPAGVSKDVLRAYIQHVGPSSEKDAETTFALAFPFDPSVLDHPLAIVKRITQGDIETMHQHLNHPSEHIRVKIARHGTTDMHERLMKDKAAAVRVAVAASATEDIVKRMVGDRSANVRTAVALRNIDEALDVLVHDSSSNVRHAVLENARPQDVAILRNDDLGTICKRAQKAILQR